MGATDWHYYTPYTPNPRDALKRLRRETFAAGAYQKPSTWREDIDRVLQLPLPANLIALYERTKRIMNAVETDAMGDLSAEDQAEAEQVKKVLQASQSFLSLHSGTLQARLGADKSPPKSIAALVRRAGESGTHSILDISKIAKRPGYGAAWPLSESELHAAFGTARPTRDDVERDGLAFTEHLERWQAVYFVVYAHDEPNEYIFAGSSGD